MSVPIGPIIHASLRIAEYFKLIETVDTKVTKLLHQQFLSAKRNLELADKATGQNQIDYIKEARKEFNQAISVEENENKILALAGLAMCQFSLGDCFNANKTITEIKDVTLSRSERMKGMAKDVGIDILISPALNIIDAIIGMPPPYPSPGPRVNIYTQKRLDEIELLKQRVLKLLQETDYRSLCNNNHD